MELRCLCRYLLKQLTVLKFLMEGGREFQIVDPEREREREREGEARKRNTDPNARVQQMSQHLSMHRVWKIVRRSAKVTELHHTYP